MKTPRNLSERELADALCRHWAYQEVHQAGSHIIIIQTEVPNHQRLAIPAHKNLRVGTLKAILKLVANHKGTTRDEILKTVL